MRRTAHRHEVLFGFGLDALMGRPPEQGGPLWRQVAGVFYKCWSQTALGFAVKECTCFLFFMGGSGIVLSEFSESE